MTIGWVSKRDGKGQWEKENKYRKKNKGMEERG
jgi:hypothetical protein